MTGREVEILLQLLPILATAAVMLTLLALLLRPRRKPRRPREEASAAAPAEHAPSADVAPAAATPQPSPAPAPARTPQRAPARALVIEPSAAPAPAAAAPRVLPAPERTGARPAAAPAPAPVSAPPAEPALPRRPLDVSADITRAQAAGARARLPELHLELGTMLAAAGTLEAAAAEVRKAILAAVPLRQHGTHATARLLLGDIAEREGDLTTACEHWQIARSLFQELAAREQHDATHKRMRRINCPTDWVLNDF